MQKSVALCKLLCYIGVEKGGQDMNNVDLGHRIKQRRTDLGLTQGDIAAEVGVCQKKLKKKKINTRHD